MNYHGDKKICLIIASTQSTVNKRINSNKFGIINNLNDANENNYYYNSTEPSISFIISPILVGVVCQSILVSHYINISYH